MSHWRDEFQKLGMGGVAEAMLEESCTPAEPVSEGSFYEDAVWAIEEAEARSGGELSGETCAAMLERALQRDLARAGRSTDLGLHFRTTMAQMGPA